jgi:hypothetical protein
MSGWNSVLDNPIVDSVVSVIDRSWTGTVSDVQRQELNSDLGRQILQAGGSAAAAVTAIREQNSFIDSAWPERSPFQTLVDVASGDPLGTGQTDYTGIIAFAAVILVAAYVLKGLLK